MKKALLILTLPIIAMACDDIEPISNEIPYNQRDNRYQGNGGYRVQPTNNSFDLVCDNRNYRASYTSPEVLVVEYEGRQILNRVRSGSGEKFQNRNIQIFLNGDDALITKPYGDSEQCQIVS